MTPDVSSLTHTTYDFYRPVGRDLAKRVTAYGAWAVARQDRELFQYGGILAGRPGPETAVFDERGRSASSLNFSSQDYLSLSSHPAVLAAAVKATQDFGVHSAGSPMIIGNTSLSVALAEELGEFLKCRHVLLFPTGYMAGFGAIVGLVRSYDYVVMDRLSHACLQQGAVAATQNIVKHRHLDVEAARQALRDIRQTAAAAGILVLSEGLFSMDADVPELASLQEVCREYDATLLVDVAHDLGSSGPGGTGQLGRQGLLGKTDVVMGSFSKSFASNGGFVATNSRAVFEYLRMYANSYMFSNALSPVQTAVVRAALRIVRSPEGDDRRTSLLAAAHALRDRFADHGVCCYGQASAIVPVPIGGETEARLVHRILRRKQVAATVIEFPIVPIGEARFRLQVMAEHTPAQAIRAADVIVESLAEARALAAVHAATAPHA